MLKGHIETVKEESMKESREHTDRREHERARVQSIVVGFLNTDEIVTTGLIDDISLGGVCFTHEMGLDPVASSIHSIDLIADSNILHDIPCEYAWKSLVDRESHSDSRYLRRCGIQFGRLSPDQTFQLRSFINRYTSLGTQNIASTVRLNFS